MGWLSGWDLAQAIIFEVLFVGLLVFMVVRECWKDRE